VDDDRSIAVYADYGGDGGLVVHRGGRRVGRGDGEHGERGAEQPGVTGLHGAGLNGVSPQDASGRAARDRDRRAANSSIVRLNRAGSSRWGAWPDPSKRMARACESAATRWSAVAAP